MEPAAPASTSERPVRRRHVFFLAGFDPRGPVHYHAVYRDEAGRQSQTQASADGTAYAVGEIEADGEHCVSWTVHSHAAGGGAWWGWRLALRWNQVWLTHALNGSCAWAAGQLPALDYFLVDALGAAGVPQAQRRVRFRMRSARFDKMVDPAMMPRIRRDPLKLHFLYLLATRRPVENDFFALTAGLRSIDARVREPAPTVA